MVLDRIAQIALIFFGALLLVLLVLGMAVSCREMGAGQIDDPTPTDTFPGLTPDDPFGNPTSTPTPLSGEFVTATIPAVPTPAITPGAEATADPAAPPDAVSSPTLAPLPTDDLNIPGATIDPNAPAATTDPNAPADTSPAAATPTPGAGSGGIPPGTTVRHAVSRGEWLLQIARCYGVAYSALRNANPIPNPDYIIPGQIITVPNAGSQGAITGPPCVVAYSVVAGDTWESLAQRHGTTTAILQRANPGPLIIGRSIWVPRVP